MSEPWMHTEGQSPFTVRVYEHAGRGMRLYLKWWDRTRGNWAGKALGRTLRTSSGRIIKHVQTWAIGEAKKQHESLLRGVPAESRPSEQLTLGATIPLLMDGDRGPYPTDTPHRREVIRAVQYAIRIWGEDRLWNSIGRADFRELRRRRARELREKGDTGLRGTEVTISRILSVAEWLRGEEKIDDRAALPEPKWKQMLKEEVDAPEPNRPRYLPEEMRDLVRKSSQIDPRLGLAVALGAELRLGQVIRHSRSSINLDAETFTLRGRGKKRGTVVALTAGQMAVVRHAITEGYLRILEQTAADYPLFPAGQLRGGRKGTPVALATMVDAKPLNRRTLHLWWIDLEKLCGIAHIPGRAAYGVRRVAVDEAVKAGISRDGMKEHGGWADLQVPERIYREQERVEAREEARDVRAKTRGEEA